MRCSSRVPPPQLQMPPDFRQRSTAGDRCKTWRQNPWPEPFLCHWSRLPVFSCHEGRGSSVAGGASPQWRPDLGSSLYRARGHRWGRLELHHECLDAFASLPGWSRLGLAWPQGFPLFLRNGCRVGTDPCSVFPTCGIMPVCVPRLLVVLRFRSILSMISAEIASAFSKLSGVGSI